MWTVHTFEVNKILFSGNVIRVDSRVVSGDQNQRQKHVFGLSESNRKQF